MIKVTRADRIEAVRYLYGDLTFKWLEDWAETGVWTGARTGTLGSQACDRAAHLATVFATAREAAFEAGRVAERKDVVAWLHLVLATGCALSVERGKHVRANEGGSDV